MGGVVSAPNPRPTREQVDEVLACVDNPYSCTDAFHRRLAVEVRALRADLDIAEKQLDQWKAECRALEAETARLRAEPAARTPQPARPEVRELVARCENVSEPDGVPCSGHLRYRWGQSDAPCDTCGGRCGIAVAAWVRVDGTPQPAEQDADEYPMLTGWDFQESRAEAVLRQAHHEFQASDRAASLFDWQADALRRAGLLAARRPAEGASLTCCDEGESAYPDACPSCEPAGLDIAAAQQVQVLLRYLLPVGGQTADEYDATAAASELADRSQAVLHTGLVAADVEDAWPGRIGVTSEDVPARLDAASEALNAAEPYSCAGTSLRGVADALRLMSPQARAAVAVALAHAPKDGGGDRG